MNSKAEVYYGNIYDLPRELGQFDVAIVGSVLEHLSDQITALASIARLTKETIVIVSPMLETEDRIARFGALADHPENDFTWWIYSAGLYREVFKMLGFSIAAITQALSTTIITASVSRRGIRSSRCVIDRRRANNLETRQKRRRRSFLRGAFSARLALFSYEAVAYCRLSSARSRLKYESNVTKPVVPWKKARPPVSCDTRFKELWP